MIPYVFFFFKKKNVNAARRTKRIDDGRSDPHAPQQVDRGGAAGPAAGGPDAVRIEPLAQALGVTRGGFYWHFEDRSALLDEMLETWERATTEEVIERLEREGGDARAKLRRLFALGLSGVVAVDLAVRDSARRQPAVAERLRRVDNRRIEYIARCSAPSARPGRGRGALYALPLVPGRQPLHRRRPGPLAAQMC